MLTTLQSDLKRWGPDAESKSPLSLQESQAYTRKVALGHYENFPVVSWFLPKHLRQPFYDVYAFCRWADDLGDEIDSTAESLRLLAWWRDELRSAVNGMGRHPVFVALADTIPRYQLSSQNFHDLISAFEQDQQQTRYETYDDLLGYCRLSANPVGRILLELTEASDVENVVLSDDVCTGLQLINFWQDIARDWKIDRVYLPQQDLAKFGATEETIARGTATEEFRELVKFEVERAEQLLKSGEVLGNRVPKSIRFDIRLFALGGLKICEKVRRQNFDTLSNRPRLTKTDLPGLAWTAWRGRPLPH